MRAPNSEWEECKTARCVCCWTSFIRSNQFDYFVLAWHWFCLRFHLVVFIAFTVEADPCNGFGFKWMYDAWCVNHILLSVYPCQDDIGSIRRKETQLTGNEQNKKKKERENNQIEVNENTYSMQLNASIVFLVLNSVCLQFMNRVIDSFLFRSQWTVFQFNSFEIVSQFGNIFCTLISLL